MTTGISSSYLWCERLTRSRAGNFAYAFLILPRAQQRAMHALYAFMRIADDIADSADPVEQKWVALQAWRRGLVDALEGRPTHLVHPALVDTVNRYRIPSGYLQELLDGVQEDLIRSRYATFAELYRYCYRVASVVGLACIHVWGFRDERAKHYAEWSGIAFQLTNILRDLFEDAQRGRIYLPLEELLAFGCSEEHLLQGRLDARFREFMQFQLQRAYQYYDLAAPLRDLLEPAGRAVFQVMTRIYRGVLDVVAHRGVEHLRQRASLSPWRKIGLVMEAIPVRFGWM
ncbi:MAG: squalene/phytoene synthase family protein [Gemmatales bacterium]|nr:squalene/phytoene synthase family protein [Gemmatales bacterium]MDW8387213.1 squalene/phytoene synthase family protein [Gemmatales bacterium]